MKLISTTIRPLDWGAVRAALHGLGLHDISVTEVQVLGRPASRAGLYRGAQYVVDHVPQTRIEVAVEDGMVARAIEAIEHAAGAPDHGQYVVKRLLAQRWTDAAPACRQCYMSEEIF